MNGEETILAAELGHRLLMLRMHFGAKQGEIAKIFGGTQGFISHCEAGKCILHTKYLQKLCGQYGISMDYFNLHNGDYLSLLPKSPTKLQPQLT